MKTKRIILGLALVFVAVGSADSANEARGDDLERQFREMPMEARRLTGPLFWLHGDANETKERLQMYLEKVAEGGNGCFCAESRPHSDWLGPRWYDDLDICLQAAKRLNLKMWIFDERWWPSQILGGKVPPEYRAKRLAAEATAVEGPSTFEAGDCGGKHFVAAVAGRETPGGVDGATLVDLSPFIREGKLTWKAPQGKWQVMKFTWAMAPKARQGGHFIVDGASRDCVDWFIKTVYQPHYDRFKDDHGKTIVGYFYDEPETQGDWGTELRAIFNERKVDWKKALVAYKFQLAGDDQVAGRYAYLDAFFEAWGRTMYGGMTRWCEERNTASIGHFMEHNGLYLDHGLGAGNLFQMQKYCSMGGMDLVCRQLYPGQRRSLYQMPKLTSSISHVYNKADDLAMCEIYGGYNQVLTYPQMKWLVDQHQVRGVNFMITHSFNPKAPHDRDYPPYFYNDGHEPRWPLYRVWADYTNRLSLMLTGGRHVCPVAFLFCGDSKYVGRVVTPEAMTSALQDALFDCDWMPYDVFEQDAKLAGKEIQLYEERYKVLIVPPVEAIPVATLEKAKKFLDAGGVVVGYGFLPSKSATLGRTSKDVAALRKTIWGDAEPGLAVCKTSTGGGRSYFLPEKPTPEQLQQVLTKDAGIHPTLEVLEGETNHWLHVLHRVKDGRDVFLVCNQNHEGNARKFTFRVRAVGEPECWDAMHGEITSVPFERVAAGTVDVRLTLEPLESVLLVFQPKKIARLARITAATKPAGKPIPVTRVEASPSEAVPKTPETLKELSFGNCPWVWFPEGDPRQSAPPGTRYFRKQLVIPKDRKIKQARLLITADNDFVLFIDGKQSGRSSGAEENWRQPKNIDLTGKLHAGTNQLAIEAINTTDKPGPAGLIGRLLVQFDEGKPLVATIDKTWKASNRKQTGWNAAGFDDGDWPAARELARFGSTPWGQLAVRSKGNMIRSPITADPFVGKCEIPSGVDLSKSRVYLEMDAPEPEAAASVTVNGRAAGGMIGGPFRLNVTKCLKHGANVIRIEPVAPKSARLVIY